MFPTMSVVFKKEKKTKPQEQTKTKQKGKKASLTVTHPILFCSGIPNFEGLIKIKHLTNASGSLDLQLFHNPLPDWAD